MGEAADSPQLEKIFREHYPAVLAYARRRAPGLAEDVAAETFAVAWRKADAIPDDPVPWLLGVARRVLATQRRSLARRIRLEQRLRITETDVGDEPRVLDGGLGDALAALSEKDREAILLIAWEELSSKQAAAALGMTATGFAVRLHRARRRLRVLLEQAGDRASSSPVDSRSPLEKLPTTKGTTR